MDAPGPRRDDGVRAPAGGGALGELRRLRGEVLRLRSELDRLDGLIDNLPAGVYRSTPDGRMLRVNRRSAEMLGYESEGDLAGRSVADLYADPADRAETVALMERDHAFVGRKIRMRRKDGSELWVAISAQAVEEEGRVAFYDGIAVDITSRVRAEEEQQRLEAQALETQKLESLGVLAGGIAHDFNNLLVGVLGNVDLALAAAPGDAAVRGHLEGIEVAARRAAELANQLLVYAGRGELRTEPVDLSAVVEEMRPLLTMSASRSDILVNRLAPDLPAVQADRSQLRQVVMNLVGNACESLGGGGGTVTIRTGRALTGDGQPLVAGGLEPDSGYVVLEVADTGCGMEEGVRRRVFEPFFSTKLPGRGLGLAAVHGIVVRHRGAIALDSAPGRGTTIRVLLPCGDARVTSSPPRPSTSEWRGAGGRALLADDDASVRAVGAQLLGLLGFEVTTAATAEEAVDRFVQDPDGFRLVVLDLMMPERGGAVALRRILALRPETPAVMSSGYSGETVCSLAQGAAGFLQKPYTLGDLRAVLEVVLGSVRA